jgi:hypothetical protein
MVEVPETKRNPHDRGRVLLIVLSLLFVLGIAAWTLVWRIPSDNRLFASLLTISLCFVAGGLVSLVLVIPAAGSDCEVKTEFYSAKAAYYCVVTGLAMAIVVTIGMILGGLHVFGPR